MDKAVNTGNSSHLLLYLFYAILFVNLYMLPTEILLALYLMEIFDDDDDDNDESLPEEFLRLYEGLTFHEEDEVETTDTELDSSDDEA